MNSRPFVETHTAGDTLDMSIANENAITVSGYPASDGWILKYRLTPQFTTPTQAPIDLSCQTDTDGVSYKLQASPAATATWKAGAYWWARWVEKAGARVMLERDMQLDILPDPTQSSQGDDRRSHARKVLEAIEAMMERRASQTQRDLVAYTIGSRSQTFDTTDTKEALVSLYSQYKWLVADEDNQAGMTAGLPNKRAVGVRFIR